MRRSPRNGLWERLGPVLFLVLFCRAAEAQTNYLRLKSFGFYESSSAGIMAPVIEASDGLLFSTSRQGGTNGAGTVFRLDKNGTNYVLLRSFGTNGDGRTPQAAVLEGRDGALYGATPLGGQDGVGTLFKLNKDGSGYAVLHTFSTNANDGRYPYGSLAQASDGLLYGVTYGGGDSNLGTVYALDSNGTGYRILKHFGSSAEDGANPAAEVVELSDGALYGTTASGGAGGAGTVFRLQRDGTGYQSLFSFSGTNGAYPRATVCEGEDGALYGTTYGGGSTGLGTLFRLSKDGAAHTVMWSFLGNDADDGAAPQYARLLQASDGFLYGTTTSGGSNGLGTIFRISTNGTSYSAIKIFRLTPGEAGTPTAGLLAGSDGMLYGTSYGGGRRSFGTVFRLNPDGSGYRILMDFPQSGGDGENPQATPVEGTDHRLYGTTDSGGAGNQGAIFSIGLDGSGYTLLKSFSGVPEEGTNPEGGVIQATDGALYGATYRGGLNDVGTLYKLNTDGSGFLVLRSFSSSGGDGQFPRARLLEASDGFLYGTTYGGGTYGAGTVFKLAKDGNAFQTLRSFFSVAAEKVDARNPIAGLMEGSDGALYGTSYNGGTNDRGAVFSISKDGSVYKLLRSFSGSGGDGAQPYAALCEASDGALYGTTASGGSLNAGTIYRLNKDGSGYGQVWKFSSTQVHTPYGALVEGKDGMLYGSALAVATSGVTQGGLFKINKDGTGFTLLHTFWRYVLSYGADGQRPYAGLLLGSDGAFYGTTQLGGDLLNAGVVFKLFTPTSPTLTLLAPPAGGSCRLRLAGIAYPAYRVEASTDLGNWMTVTNLSNPTGRVEFRVPAPPGSTAFYRAMYAP